MTNNQKSWHHKWQRTNKQQRTTHKSSSMEGARCEHLPQKVYQTDQKGQKSGSEGINVGAQ
jgi:hypothetical protein